MGRNSELIRQWTLLHQLAAVRTNTIPQLAVDLKVSTRTTDSDVQPQPAVPLQSARERVSGRLGDPTIFRSKTGTQLVN